MNFFTLKLHRRMSPRAFALSAVLLTILLCVYYSGFTSDIRQGPSSGQPRNIPLIDDQHDRITRTAVRNSLVSQDTPLATCPKLGIQDSEIDTLQVFRKFDFQPAWVKNKEYWDKSFEDRWLQQTTDKVKIQKFPLKVIIVPHSHNDPGWLRTYEQYFYYESKEILNHMIKKLNQYPNMTFIWSEISFLSLWWDQAHPTKRKAFKKLIDEGRVEITTGGWVMTDEATSHIYAMVDQLIEGHQWLQTKLNYKPKTGWSIDPFGHGSTVPYLLSMSGITGTVIQRIHYAWKQWLAKNLYGDFMWVPAWKTHTSLNERGAILTHNQPFDIYSIKHSCGPHPFICLHFDFRKLNGEYTEQSAKAVEIDSNNIERKSKTLVGQYSRTGSLFPHNVVLMPLGDDFRYNNEIEWDQQYTNYKKIMDFVNSHSQNFDNTEIVFGTPKDYFEEISKRYTKYPKLKGDFFVYSDIFSEGRPAYWSGYYTTRPFVKLLDRQLEHNLRNAEILFTIALNKARENKKSVKLFDRKYEKLIKARRNLGLFQHHDAITGTSKFNVMKDYSQKLFESVQDTLTIQQDAIQSLISNDIGLPSPSAAKLDATKFVVLSNLEYESSDRPPRMVPITLEANTKQIILFNSLGQPLDRVITLKTTNVNIKISDAHHKPVLYQINPIWNATKRNLQVIENEFEVIFIAKLPAFSLITFHIEAKSMNMDLKKRLATIYCDVCNNEEKIETKSPDDKKKNPIFKIKSTQPGDIQLETSKLRLLIDGTTGFLKSVFQKNIQRTIQCQIQFSAYPSAQFHSGAYLFMPDPNARDAEKNVLEQYISEKTIIITSGPVSSELSVMYGPFLIHTIRIYHNHDSILSSGIYIENEVDFEKPPKNRETEFFMRIMSDIQNNEPPEFYTDLNGFQMQKRVKVQQIGIEGNYFPITTMAYIEDDSMRLSLLTNHAQGAASWQPGYLEVMLERRSLYDDMRGMGEGLVDNVRTTTKYWLLIEQLNQVDKNDNTEKVKDILRTFNTDVTNDSDKFSRPSLYANTLSNMLIYPVNIFTIEGAIESSLRNKYVNIIEKLPCDVHLMNFRTLPDQNFAHFPSVSALMVLHRQGHDCSISVPDLACDSYIFDGNLLSDLKISTVERTSLTGLHTESFITNMSNLIMDPMSLTTLQITFKSDK